MNGPVADVRADKEGQQMDINNGQRVKQTDVVSLYNSIHPTRKDSSNTTEHTGRG